MSSFEQIRAKRRSMGPDKIAERVNNGTAHGKERALVRMGVANTRIITGQDDLSDWDDEELRRGKKRNRNGGWIGRDPVIVPKALHDELVRRTISKTNQLMVNNLYAAVTVLTEIVSGADIEPKDKLTAIRMIMDRVMGKEPQKIEVSGEAKWQIAIQQGIISLPDALGGEPDDYAIDTYEEEDNGDEED